MISPTAVHPPGHLAWRNDPASSTKIYGGSYCFMAVSCCGRFLEGPEQRQGSSSERQPAESCCEHAPLKKTSPVSTRRGRRDGLSQGWESHRNCNRRLLTESLSQDRLSSEPLTSVVSCNLCYHPFRMEETETQRT